MKKIFILLAILHISYFIFHTSSVINAQTPTETSDIEDIKDKLIENIASRVAQLNLVEKRGIVGTVTDVTNTQITLSDIENNTRFVDVDELTKFSSPDQEESFGISDITKGTTVSALGLYNKESRRLLARFVNVATFTRFIHGEVGAIDTLNRTFDVVAEDSKQTKIDVGKSTLIFSYTRSNEDLTRVLFSNLKTNLRLAVVGFPDAENENLIIADRIILFPEIPSVIRPNETTSTSTQSAERK